MALKEKFSKLTALILMILSLGWFLIPSISTFYKNWSFEWEPLILVLSLFFGIIGIEIFEIVGNKEKIFDDVSEAAPMIKKLIQIHEKTHYLKIIVSTGGLTIDAYLRDLLENHTGRLDISINFLKFDNKFYHLLPGSWPNETIITIETIEKLIKNKSNITFNYKYYNYLPCIQGVLIDEVHLFVGFFSWKNGENRFANQNNIYTYYKLSKRTKKHFGVFNNWFYGPHTDEESKVT